MSTPLPLTVIQLGCFVTVAETGSFAEAGRRLGMTTSGVSKTIGRLEEGRGVRLLNRSTHAVSTTPEGERLLPLAREAIRRFGQVETALGAAAAGDADGLVRISAPTAFLRACLAPLLPRLREALPHVTLDLRGSDEMVDLADEAVDLVLRTGPLKGIPGHLGRLLFRFPWVTCASPNYLTRRGAPMDPDDLAGHDLIGFRNQRTGLVEPWLYRSGTGAGSVRVQPDPALILDDANAIAAAATAGAGIAWAPRWLVSAALGAGELVPVMTDWAGEEMAMSLVRRDGLVPRRVEQVVAFLKEQRRSFALSDRQGQAGYSKPGDTTAFWFRVAPIRTAFTGW